MAISVVGVSNAAGQAAGTTSTPGPATVTPTLPSGAAIGDRIYIFQMAYWTSASVAVPTNWNALFEDVQILTTAGGASVGRRYMSCYWRDRDSAWSMPAISTDSGMQNSNWVGAIAIRPSSGYAFDSPTYAVGSNDGGSNTAHTSTTASFSTIADALLLIGSINNDAVTSTGGTVTQSGATFGSVTERMDGNTSTGNDVSGRVHTAPVTTGATAAVTFASTLSAASEGGSIIVQQTESPLPPGDPITDFTDDFASGTLANWTQDNLTASWAVSSGAARVNRTSAGLEYAALYAIDGNTVWDVTGSALTFQVPYFSSSDAASTSHLYVQLASPGQTTVWPSFRFYGTSKTVQPWVGVAAVGSSRTHVDGDWYRIRESGGTLYWEYSSDGTSWTTLHSAASTLNMTRVAIVATAWFNASGVTIDARLDNVNLPPSGVNHSADFFFAWD